MDHTATLSFSSRKKIFITGIAGFIGFHLAKALHKRGDLVFGCDNFNPYYDPKLKRDRSSLLSSKGIPVWEKDICDKGAIRELVAKEQATHIVHLAAQAGVRYSLTNPDSYVHSNLDGFVQLLEVCKENPSIKFIYASSSSVYGLNTKIPFAESDMTDAPSNFYGATKKANELIAHAYHHLYKVPVTGLRFFTVYGPWGRPDMAYFSFARAIMQGSPVPLFHKGEMQRDFTYIDDIIQGCISAIDLGADCELFNLGHNKPHSVNELISYLEIALNKKAVIEHKPMQPGEVPITFADIAKSRQKLGFEPKVPLKKGIELFAEWYKQYH